MTDMIFQKVQENVGILASDQTDVLEPILATNHFISYQSVESNRQEVNMCKIISLSFLVFFPELQIASN